MTEKSLTFSALIFWSISESSAYSACNLALSMSGLRDSAIASVVSLFSASTPVIVSGVTVFWLVSVSTGSNAAFSAAALISAYFYLDLVFFTAIIITIVMIIIIINSRTPIAKEVLLAGFIFFRTENLFFNRLKIMSGVLSCDIGLKHMVFCFNESVSSPYQIFTFDVQRERI